mgnify:CR=1 FL=1
MAVRFFSAIFCLLITLQANAQIQISINTSEQRKPISPYIYGSNQDLSDNDAWTVRRLGGNRLTGYNWENNASNAGKDWFHSSDDFLVSFMNIPANQANRPGIVMTEFHDRSLVIGAESVLTLQMAGFVAKDKNGTVQENETAPSPRWVAAKARKDGEFALTPDLTDNAVYMDELVNFLISEFGQAQEVDGVRWYALDNEPALWSSTHPRISPGQIIGLELVNRSIEMAAAIKDVDPAAEILGPALYGFNAFHTLQDALDWPVINQNFRWFIDYYLDKMKNAEESAGRRLIDVLDVHWYPEARGDHRIVFDGEALTPKDVEARVQAPRTLWDPTYFEDSWIGMWRRDFLPLIPNLQQSIENYYPGTKLSFTEFAYGGGGHVSGGLAHADALGIFGKYGIYLATYWQEGEDNSYVVAANNLFRNYDGNFAAFGNTSVAASSSNIEKISVYASIVEDAPEKLHLILLNKDFDAAQDLNISIESDALYEYVDIWTFDDSSPEILYAGRMSDILENALFFQIPKASAVHLVFSGIFTSVTERQRLESEVPFLMKAYPTPFNAELRIEYSVLTGETGVLKIFDLHGRVVRTFSSLTGSGNLVWNGEDESGVQAASGAFFLKLTAGEKTLSRRVTFLK